MTMDSGKETLVLIKKKLIMLKNRMPFSPEMKRYFADIERREWILGNMKIDGSSLTEGQIEAVARGDVCLNMPIAEHVRAERITSLLEKLWEFAEMKRTLDLNLLDEIHRFLSKDAPKNAFRKKNAMLSELEYTPPIPAEIPEELRVLAAEMIKASEIREVSSRMFRHAAFIHNKIVEIYPYGEEDKLLARAAAAYYIMTRGLPAVALPLKEQEYNSMIANHIKKGALDDMSEAWQQAILSRLSLMIQLTRY